MEIVIYILGAITFFLLGFAFGYMKKESQQEEKEFRELMDKIDEL